MLDSVSYKNFKVLRDIQLCLERFTLIVGPNASGKSSVLQGLDLIGKLISHSPEHVFSGESAPNFLRTCATEVPIELRATVKAKDSEPCIICTIAETPKDSSTLARWEFHVTCNADKKRQPAPPGRRRSEGTIQGMYPNTAKLWPATRYLRLDPIRLAQSSTGGFPRESLDLDGYGLPSLLATLSATKRQDFEALHSALASIVPPIKGLTSATDTILQTKEVWFEDRDGTHSYRIDEEELRGFKLLIETANGGQIPANAASEGALLVLGLLAEIFSSTKPTVLLLDNLDRGLHPRAMKDFVGRLRTLVDQFPSLQIIAATHSPYLVDLFDPGEIRLICLDEEGFAICGSLTDHPDFGKWRDEMLPGEFWSMVGENWLRNRAVTSS